MNIEAEHSSFKKRRVVSWYSCGAASAVATKLANPDVIVYCETGAEDKDNARFMADCEAWFGKKIKKLASGEYLDVWDLWKTRRYLSGTEGALCTLEMKVKPRLAFQEPNDIHVFGYTADLSDIKRSKILKENWPKLKATFPLITWGLNKVACLAMLQKAGIKPPRVYAMGFSNANCIPCVKATSPSYWALIRRHFPVEFNRMVKLSRDLDVKLTRINKERIFIDEIPADYPVTEPLAPECDILCSLATEELEWF